MAIQFRCSSCKQPIEIDDDGAGEWVACPFCNHTDRAPAQSDPSIHYDVPVAASVASPQAGVSPIQTPPAAKGRRCACGLVALLCAVAAILSLCIISFALTPALMKSATPGNPLDTKAAQETAIQFMKDKPWLMLLNLVVTGIPFVGGVFGVISLSRSERPRWLAVCGLAVCGILVLIHVMGVLLVAV